MRQTTIALLIAIAACGGSDTSSTAPKSVAGTYALVTYQGSVPPVVLLDDPASSLKIEVLTGTFNIGVGAGSGYSTTTGLRTTDHGVVTASSFTCTGTFVLGGNKLAFTEVQSGQYCGGNFVANWDGSDALTFTFKNGDVATFRR
jgi:hypothetical protein